MIAWTRAILVLGAIASIGGEAIAQEPGAAAGRAETPEQRDARMAWWREARFGLFIHWGLYAIPAGEWKGGTNYGEWIRHSAQIPIDEYDKFRGRFNPVKFDAEQWVQLAKQAGMKYIVITSKHHDGFCLFDSEHTDFDVMSTPFQRDIMKELSDACRRHGLKMCWYHSIMDWHHPDYLPRREWEAADRPADGADFDRFRQYLKNQVRELLTKYGPIGVMWFDGEWEETWTHEHGVDLYNYVRGIDPNVIVNNRVDKGRAGMAGMTIGDQFMGDFGTPEQEIPATGFPGVDWESCMTMNTHWGWNKRDKNFKSARELIHMLIDIASKGGNFLLNIGPTAEGEFPPECVERLRDIGAWMEVHGESIYGTQASPFKSLPWGRCTQKRLEGDVTRLYLHVFDWPAGGTLVVPGILNEPRRAVLMTAGEPRPVDVSRRGESIVVRLPRQPADPVASVVALEISGRPDVTEPPQIAADATIFIDALEVRITSEREHVELRYTLDGSEPGPQSPVARGPVRIDRTATVSARAFRGGQAVSGVRQMRFERVRPRAADDAGGLVSGLSYEYYEGEWTALPDFDALEPAGTGTVGGFDFAPRKQSERFAFRYRGHVLVPRDGVYTFHVSSDDGSRLYIGDELVVDNDGLHGAEERSGQIALAAGAQPITVTFFERTGSDLLEVSWSGPGMEKQRIAGEALRRRP